MTQITRKALISVIPLTLSFSGLANAERLNSMSNEELVAAAQAESTDKHCPTQKALNHQWLAHHNGEQKAKTGGKALQFIAKSVLKNYWGDEKIKFNYLGQKLGQKSQQQHSLASKKNKQSFNLNKLDYGVKISGSKLKLAVEYEF